MKTKLKKALAVVLVMTIAMSMFTVCGFAASEADSLGTEIGTAIGTIVFLPFILVDEIIWIITGVHVFYWW